MAPGEDIYSSVVSGYSLMSGTSMAAPHATGVAGLLFAANPDLTGPQVKQLMIASTSGRFYYEGGSSGMINAEKAVISGLQTETEIGIVGDQQSGEQRPGSVLCGGYHRLDGGRHR